MNFLGRGFPLRRKPDAIDSRAGFAGMRRTVKLALNASSMKNFSLSQLTLHNTPARKES